ncbi:hypothetical protein FRC03_012021 [Tulasnella sp. 419]|nr:hypothetical protein FRC03_012021 [Tulasnella sp. 419]
MIEGTDMADFFEPSCAAAVAAIRAHVTPGDNTNVMLVGGFAASPWLYSEIQRRLRNLGIKFHRADGGTAKAAAHGAVSFYLDHLVSARVVRWTHGVSASVQFDPTDPKHFMRLNKVYTDPLTGEDYIPKGFAVLLNKGTLVDEKKPHRIPLRRKSLLHKNIELELEIRCYQGDEPNIEFLDEDDKDMFYEACMVKATIPKECLVRHARHAGPPPPFLPSHYWTCTFAVVASFGATEFQCYIEWRDQQGTLQRGPATSLWVEA